MRALALCLCGVLSQAVVAGPWEAADAQGLVLRITHETYRARDAYVLTRSYPDGSVDVGFGQQGSLLFTLGPDNDGPGALRLDPTGRIWIGGATAGRGDSLQAVVIRFLAHGVVDQAYGEGGRSVTAPSGLKARALDIAPQSDGSCFVVGTVVDRQGGERTGWWRLGPDGRVDPRFGLGGLWSDPQGGATEVVDLVRGADGSLGLGIRRGDSATSHLEVWALAPGRTQPEYLHRSPDDAAARLVWQAGQWRWVAGGRALALASPASTLAPPSGASESAASPGTAGAKASDAQPLRAPPAASVVAVASGPQGHSGPGGRAGLVLAALAVAAVVGAVIGWRRHR